MKRCKSCAELIKDTDTICKHCGREVNISKAKDISSSAEETKYQEKNNYYNVNMGREDILKEMGLKRGPYKKWITLLLTIFLGIFGVHKFYEGKYFVGLLYLLTFGFVGIGVIRDIFWIVKQDKEYYVSTIPFIPIV